MKEQIQLSDHFSYSRLIRFTLPSIAMMVFTSIYSVVDGFFISNFAGKTAFASLNLIWPFLMILGGMGFMVGTGGTALVSQMLGSGDKERARGYFSMMVEFTILLGLVLTAVGLIFMKPIARFLGATEEMIPDCVLYGRIVISFNVAFMLQNVFHSFLIAAEKPQLGLIATVGAGVTNMVLDALLVGVFRRSGAGDRSEPDGRRCNSPDFLPKKGKRLSPGAPVHPAGTLPHSQRLRQRLLRAHEQHFRLRGIYGV